MGKEDQEEKKMLLDLAEKMEDKYAELVERFNAIKRMKLRILKDLDKQLLKIHDELRICDMWVRRNHGELKEVGAIIRSKMRMVPRDRD